MSLRHSESQKLITSLCVSPDGVWAEGQKTGSVVANIDGTIILDGEGAIGIHARGNATINVTQSAIPKFQNGTNQIGFFSYGDNAFINIATAVAGSTLAVQTDRSTLFRLENGADFMDWLLANQLHLQTIGVGSKAFIGSGAGTIINLARTTIDLAGEKSIGLIIEGGATGNLTGSTDIQVNALGAIGILVDGIKRNLSGAPTAIGGGPVTQVINSGAINGTANANQAFGVILRNNGIMLNNSPINFASGTDNTGVWIDQGGRLENRNAINVSHGVGILVDGAGAWVSRAGAINVADGEAGIKLTNGAVLKLDGPGTINVNGTASGILVGSNTTAAKQLYAGNVTINVLGTGEGIQNAAEIAAITLNGTIINVSNGSGIRTAVSIDPASVATINVSGSGSGFGFKTITDGTTTGNLTLGKNYTINVTGANGIGIEALTTGTVVTAANVTVSNANGGPALLAGTASSSLNLGTLVSTSTTAPVVDLSNRPVGSGTTFENMGVITAASPTALAVRGSSGDDTLLFGKGSVQGDINSGDGNDYVLFDGGTLNGSITTGSGDNTVYIKNFVSLANTSHVTSDPGGNSNLFLENIMSARGGSFSSDNLAKGTNFGTGWHQINLNGLTRLTLTDNLTLSGSAVNIGFPAVLFAGNNVNPVISGGTPTSLVVNNSGKIDLTNGDSASDTLTIQGNYNSINGNLWLNTVLNVGGPLSAQITDRLLVNGDVTGATKVSLDFSQGGLGGITDTNRDGLISSTEGISIIQVSGSSTSEAFQLTNKTISSGAFVYTFYPFSPGEASADQRLVAGSGNQFWDYRLANAFVCPPGTQCTNDPARPPGMAGSGSAGVARPQLISQAPAYISLPMGVAMFEMSSIDDLHKRLGELRYNSTVQGDYSREVFARYIGHDLEYNTNVSFKNYGYDFGFKSNALQIGGTLLKITTDNQDVWRAGVAWTHGDSRLTPYAADGRSEARIRSDMLGLYVTYEKANGFYVDGVLSYNMHKSEIDAQFQSSVGKIRGKGFTASLETGYPIRFNNGVVFEPQAQLTYQNIKFDNVFDKTGVDVRYGRFEQTTARIGARLYKTWITENGNQITPYARVNFYKGWGSGSNIYIGQTDFANSGYNFRGGKFDKAFQVGLGLTATFKNDLSIFGEVDYQRELGDGGTKGWRFSLGLKKQF